MKRIELLTGYISVSKIISVNEAYTFAYNSKKDNPRKILSDKSRKMKHEILVSLGAQFPDHALNPDRFYEMNLGFYFKQNVMIRDDDNPIKMIRDSIAEHFGFDDRRIFYSSQYKKQIINAGKLNGEYIKFTLSELRMKRSEVYIDLSGPIKITGGKDAK